MVFWPCDAVPLPELCKKEASCNQAGTLEASSAGGQAKCESFKLVSSQFRQQCLAVWESGQLPAGSLRSLVP